MYEDSFYLTFMRQLAKVGMVTYSAALTLAILSDIMQLYKKSLNLTSQLYEKAT